MNVDSVAFKPEDANGDNRWRCMHERYKKESESFDRCNILFIGDSIVQQLQFTKVYQEYVSKVKHVFNAGIGGDKVEHVLWRIRDGDWIDRLKPNIVVLFVGTNNVKTTPERTAELLEITVNTIKDKLNDCYLIIPHLLPRGEFPNILRERNKQSNDIIKSKYSNKETSDKIFLVDMERDKIINENGLLHHSIMHDYLHLTELGYELTWSHVFDLCNEILDKK